MGEHRFSRYALIFRIDEPPRPARLGSAPRPGRSSPARRGRVYRTLVIGTRGHVLATRSILRSVRRRAERS